ncbi:MAG: hypothetical protein KGL74_08035 [Elusimicrobia bacterium]|nr:hypothetical protein [Elusimicrobiota bacterium]MDE2511056.1 hypothetical protein [Elusimicrobiota bacterium]
MNSVYARRLLVAFAACDPAGPYGALQESIAEGREWEGALRGGEAPLLRVEAPARERGGRPFSARDFEEPVASALKAFHALEPIAAVRFGRGGGSWTLILERPAPWPLFLRCDLAASFAPRAAQLSLLLRDARVTALEFDGEALWARFTD